MDTLALTDRDGTYGAVKFAQACRAAGIRPVLGVDLAYRPVATEDGPSPPGSVPHTRTRRRVPRPDLGQPAAGHPARLGRRTRRWPGRLGGDLPAGLRGAPGRRARPPGGHPRPAGAVAGRRATVTVLLGPGSEIGAAAARGVVTTSPTPRWRRGARWCRPGTSTSSWSPTGSAGHRWPGRHRGLGSRQRPHAARMAGVAHRAGIGSVLTNAVRYADRRDAPTVDVLDAARRLVALDRRHLDRANAEGFLKSGKQMLEVAEEVCRMAGLDGSRWATRLLARTRAVADSCALDPRADLGLGEVHFPELDVSGGGGRRRAAGPLRGCGRRPLRLRPAPAHLEAPRRRARADPRPRLRVVLPHRRRRHRPDPRARGALRGARVGRGQPGQLPARRLRHRPDPPPPADGAVPLAAARVAARHRRRRRVRAAHRDLRGDPRPLRRRALRVRLDDGHLPRPPRRARRGCRARHAAGRDRHHRQGVPPHPRPRRPGGAARAARAAGERHRRPAARPDVRARRAARRAAPPHRRAPVRGAALRHHPARPHARRGELRGVPDEPVRQGRRRGARPAQARRARHPHAVLDGARRRADPRHHRRRDRPRRPASRCRSRTTTPTG